MSGLGHRLTILSEVSGYALNFWEPHRHQTQQQKEANARSQAGSVPAEASALHKHWGVTFHKVGGWGWTGKGRTRQGPHADPEQNSLNFRKEQLLSWVLSIVWVICPPADTHCPHQTLGAVLCLAGDWGEVSPVIALPGRATRLLSQLPQKGHLAA